MCYLDGPRTDMKHRMMRMRHAAATASWDGVDFDSFMGRTKRHCKQTQEVRGLNSQSEC